MTPPNKRLKTDDAGKDTYHLIYWPGIPGRGEPIRLALEAASASYTDSAHAADKDERLTQVLTQISDENLGTATSPPPLAPPILRHNGVTLCQLPNILLYLGPKLDLAPDPATDPTGLYMVNQLALIALDGLSNEAHDTHHPIATGKYYDDQRDEAAAKAADYRATRLPKFLAYFERVLAGDASRGGEYLYAGRLSYADLVLFHCLDGVAFAFPRRIKTLRDSADYDRVFALHERVRRLPPVKAYLESDRRQKYADGIYRHYPELDAE